jgi:WD40 repeat protein
MCAFRKVFGFIFQRLLLLFIFAILTFTTSCISKADPESWNCVCALSFSPDNQMLAVGTYSGKQFNEDFRWQIGDLHQTVALFDAKTGHSAGSLVDLMHSGSWAGLPSKITGQFLTFSPSQTTAAVGSWDGTVTFWNVMSGNPIGSIQTGLPHITTIDYSGNGRIFAAGYHCWLTVWNSETGLKVNELAVSGTIRSIALSPDGDFVAIGYDGEEGTELWDVQTGERRETLPIHNTVASLRFSPDGRTLAIAGEKSLNLWNIKGHSKCLEIQEQIGSLAFSRDGRTLITAGAGAITFWNTEMARSNAIIRPTAKVVAFSSSADGALIAIGDITGSVSVWDVTSGAQLWSIKMVPREPSTDLVVLVACAGVLILLFAICAFFWKIQWR